MFTARYKILIFTLVITILTATNAFAVTSDFYDTDMHFAEEHIDTLYALGVMKGSSNLANPECFITRGEFSALTARSFLNYDSIDKQIFPDIPKNHMFSNEINALYEANIITGRENGNFDPESHITRGEIALILSKIKNVNYPQNSNADFTDIKKDSIYWEPVSKLSSISVINGYNDNTFKPFKNATRGECTKMIGVLLKSLNISPNGDKIKEISKNFINSRYNGSKILKDDLTGSAKENAQYKDSVNEYIKLLGAEVKKTIKDLTFSEILTEGALSKLYATYEITFNVNGNINTYDAKTELCLKSDGKNIKIYYFDDDFKEQSKINLTWMVSESLPSHKLTGVTHISPPVFQVSKENLGVASEDVGLKDARLYTPITKKVMDYANSNNLKLWPIYKTDFTLSTSDSVLNNKNAQENIIKSIIRHSIINGFDGINIDFENVYQRNKGKLSNHIKKLSLALSELGMIVSCDITKYEKTSANWSMCYDRDAIGKSCDYVMLMAYDQYYAGSTVAGPVSGIGWADKSIVQTLDEVESNKLVLGIPFYIRYWETQNGKVVSTKALSMMSAQNLADKNGAKYVYDSTHNLTRAYWYNDKGILCTYWVENAESIIKRVNLANKYNLGGVASWRQGFETADIWDAINLNLNK